MYRVIYACGYNDNYYNWVRQAITHTFTVKATHPPCNVATDISIPC